MLKWIYVNDKRVPVPVPVMTLAQAVVWVDKTLVPQGHSITRVTLDGRPWSDELDGQSLSGEMTLTDKSRLEVRIDSPIDLAVQTLSAIRNLADIVEGGLKNLAVECWQAKPKDSPAEVGNVENDIGLINELTQHLQGLIDSPAIDLGRLLEASEEIKRINLGIMMARSQSDWRGCARLLLNKLEPELGRLIGFADELNVKLLSLRSVTVSKSLSGAKTG